MSQYLRDERIANVWISSEILTQLAGVFNDRVRAANERVNKEDLKKLAFVSYVIRFDNRGNRVFSVADLVRQFQLANDLERVIFNLESAENFQSNRQRAPFIELRLDSSDPNAC